MNLSYKDKQFIIEAIDYRLKAYQECLQDSENIDEDLVADWGNDSKFLEALRNALVKSVKQNYSFSMPEDLKREAEVKEKSLSNFLGLSWEEKVRQLIKLSVKERLVLVDAITESIRQQLSSFGQ